MVVIARRLGRAAAILFGLVASGLKAVLAASASASGCHLLGRRQGHTGFRARRARQSGVQTDGGFKAAEPRRSIGSGATGEHCVNDAFVSHASGPLCFVRLRFAGVVVVLVQSV